MTKDNLTTKEYNPYYQTYINKSGELNLMDGLQANLGSIISFLKSIPEEKLEYRYDKGKWTVKEIIQHLMDTERIFAYRTLRIARQDATGLPGFDQDEYVLTSNANTRTLEQLLDEYSALRHSTIHLFASLSEKDLMRLGTASNSPISPRAMGFIIIGHENHHCDVIKQRYL